MKRVLLGQKPPVFKLRMGEDVLGDVGLRKLIQAGYEQNRFFQNVILEAAVLLDSDEFTNQQLEDLQTACRYLAADLKTSAGLEAKK